MIARRRLGLWLLCALGLCAPRAALAAEANGWRVLLIEDGRDPFLERVGAEIEGLGFALVRSPEKGPLESAARTAQAAAAIRVLPSRKGVEVWMADATSGRSLLRQVVVDESPGGPDRDLIALQTAELLRTSLLQEKPAQQANAQPKAAPAPASPSEMVRAAPRSRDTSVQLGFGALYSPGGASAAAEIALSVQRFFGERWGVGVDLGGSVRAGKMTGPEGSAKIAPYFAGALLVARFQPRPSPFFASVGAGPALVLIGYDGAARVPLRASSGSQLTGAAYLRGDVGVEAASFLRFGLRALGGASFQRIAVRFAGNETGHFGPIFLAGFALAELALP